MSRVLIVGGFPPPFGGVTVHIQRLFEIISKDNSAEVIDFYGSRGTPDIPAIVRCGTRKPLNLAKAVCHIFNNGADLIHFHISAIGNFCIAGFPLIWSARTSTPKVLTIHSGSFLEIFNKANFLKKTAFRYLAKKIDHIIVVNEKQKDILRHLDLPVDRVSVIPAFLPPVAKRAIGLERDISGLRSKSDVLILVSGPALRYYGFHTALEALRSLRGINRNISLIFAFYTAYDEPYVTELEAGLSGGFPHLVYRDLRPDEFSYLLSLVDIYIRATDRDGDSVALREAAYFGKQIIASDCVQRPEGAVLFKTMDPDSLGQAIARVIESESLGHIEFDFESNKLKLLNIYSTLLRPGTPG